jgi:3-(3-hydroxy-phenyl)propionate hydroxylase
MSMFFRRCEEPGVLEREDPRIAIVGAGPVGLTAALTLARHGVPSVLYDEDATVCDGSRAVGMSRRTLEIWAAVNAVDGIAARGIDWRTGRSFHRGRTVLSFAMPDDPGLRFRPMFNISQAETERFLVDALNATAMADIEWGTRVTGAMPQASEVALGLETASGPVRARHPWVLACDGARSVMRSALGLHLEGTSYEASYVIADIALETEAPIERRCWFDPPSNPGSTVLMHRQPGNIWRLDYQLRPDEDPERATDPDRVRPRIQQHLDFIGERGPWTLVWASIYRVHSRGLKDFRHGRVLFAGDAAHLMPIFGIRGLNSGVEDAWNAGTKLAFVHQGKAEESLLDAYSAERRAVFLENIALADRNAWFMTPPSPGARVLRDAVLELAVGVPAVQDIINPKQAAYVPLRTSPLSAADDDTFPAGPSPGDVVPDVDTGIRGSDGKPVHLQSLLDPTRYACIVFSEADVLPPEIERTWPELAASCPLQQLRIVRSSTPGNGRLPDPAGRLHQRFDATDGTVYLVRPDHHILGRWRRWDAGVVGEALARALGRVPARPARDAAAPVLSAAETVYRRIGAALGPLDERGHTLFLAKLALQLGLRIADDEALSQCIATAAADLPSSDRSR